MLCQRRAGLGPSVEPLPAREVGAGCGEGDRQTHRWADPFGDCCPGSGVEEGPSAPKALGRAETTAWNVGSVLLTQPSARRLSHPVSWVMGWRNSLLSITERWQDPRVGAGWTGLATLLAGTLGRDLAFGASLPGLHSGGAPASQCPGEGKELRASPGPFLVHFPLTRDR